MRTSITVVTLAALFFGATPAIAGPTPEEKCQGGKNQAAGKYADCTAKAENTYVATGDVAKYTAALAKCETNMFASWDKLEAAAAAAATTCPSMGDEAPIADFVDACVQSIAIAVAGGPLGPDPLTCASDLATCQAQPPAAPLKTGRITCHDDGGFVIPCAGTGQDGESQKGIPRDFTDNGDGTISDHATGLMWEKLVDDGSIHDADNTYQWNDAFVSKIGALNTDNFAGHDDWRMPNQFELYSLVNLAAANPAVYSPFHNACLPGCTAATCACTRAGGFWASDPYQGNLQAVWTVNFNDAFTGVTSRSSFIYIRAVRDDD